MIIQKIDYKGINILRAYKNGEIVWNASEILYFDIGRTVIPLKYFITTASSGAPLIKKMFTKISHSRDMGFYSSDSKIREQTFKITVKDTIDLQSEASANLVERKKIKVNDIVYFSASHAPYFDLKDIISSSTANKSVIVSDESEVTSVNQVIENLLLTFLNSSPSRINNLLHMISFLGEENLVSSQSHRINKNLFIKEQSYSIARSVLSQRLPAISEIKQNLNDMLRLIISKKMAANYNINTIKRINLNNDDSVNISNRKSIKINLLENLRFQPSGVSFGWLKIENIYNVFLNNTSSRFFDAESHTIWYLSSFIEFLPITSRYCVSTEDLYATKHLYLNNQDSEILNQTIQIILNKKEKLVSSDSKGAWGFIMIGEVLKTIMKASRSKETSIFNKVSLNRDDIKITVSLSVQIKLYNKIETLKNYITFKESKSKNLVQNLSIEFLKRIYFDASSGKRVYWEKSIGGQENAKITEGLTRIFRSLNVFSSKLLLVQNQIPSKIITLHSIIEQPASAVFVPGLEKKVQIIKKQLDNYFRAQIFADVAEKQKIEFSLLKLKGDRVLKLGDIKKIFNNVKIAENSFMTLVFSIGLLSLQLSASQRHVIYVKLHLHSLFEEFLQSNINNRVCSILEFFRLNSSFRENFGFNCQNVFIPDFSQENQIKTNIKQRLKHNLSLTYKNQIKDSAKIEQYLYEILSLSHFNFIPTFYSRQFVFSSSILSGSEKLKNFVSTGKTKILLYFNIQKACYSEIKLKEQAGEKIYSSLVLDDGDGFKWIYPIWIDENNIFIQQVFNFSYESGEIE